MAKLNISNQALAYLTIDGVQVFDVADTDQPIRLVTPDTMSTIKAGMNSTAASVAFNPTGTLEVDLFSQSDTLLSLQGLFLLQQTTAATFIQIVVGSSVSDTLVLSDCLIKTIGTIETGGKENANQTIVFTVSNVIPNVS